MGDWVLRRISTLQTKLQPNWEGPFEVVEVVGNDAYRLKETHRGKPALRTWNALYLRKYYYIIVLVYDISKDRPHYFIA